MSEFLAEAQVLIKPITTGFRTSLIAQIGEVQRSIPPIIVPVIGDAAALQAGAGAATVQTAELTAALEGLTAALTGVSTKSLQAAGGLETVAGAEKLTAAAANDARRAVLAQSVALTGMRGAVLGANSAFLLAAAGTLAFFKSLSLAAGVEQDLAQFRVTVEATAQEMSAVSEEAKQLGRDLTLPGVGARDAVQAMLALAKAGLTVQDSMDAARGVLQLATAADLDNAVAANLVANALNAFGLAGNQAVNVADLLANAANESQASLEDMGIALRQSAASAEQVGLSVNDTVVLLTQLAKAGIAGSDAGTTLRVALARLIAPTKGARTELQKLGVDLRDVQGNVRPDIFAQIGVAMQGLDRASQDNAFITIFGQNAQRVASILARQGVPALRDTQKALEKQGTAGEVASAKNEGLAGSVENAKNQFAAFSLEIGQLAAPLAGLGLDAVALLFGTLADSIGHIHESVKQQIDDLEQLAAAFGKLSDESGFTQFVSDVNEGGKLLQGDFERLGRAVTDLGPDLFGLRDAAASVDPPVVQLSKSLQTYIDAGERAGATTLRLADNMDTLAQSTAQAATPQAKLNLSIEGARAGGSDDSLIALLQEREANLQKFIDRLSSKDQTKAVVATLTKANQDLANTRDEINSLLDQRAQDTERAAKDAQQARDKTDAAFLDLLGGRRERAQNLIGRAAGTDSLKDDIKFQQQFLNLLKLQVERVRKTVKDAQTRVGEIRSLTAQIVSVGNELKNLRQQQRDALAQAADARAARIEQSIQLDIDFAQTIGNRQKEIKARQRLIALLKKQLHDVKKGTNAWKELRNAIAEQQAAIKEARDQGKKTAETGSNFGFEFLQKQQGFAANLMGNLIPGFATGGLVGNTSPPADQLAANAQTSASVLASQGRGVRPVQVDTTNSLLRQILAALNGRHTNPPEISHNQRVGSAMMDTMGSVHGI